MVCGSTRRGEHHRPGRHKGERFPEGRDQRRSADRLTTRVPFCPASLHGKQGAQRGHARPRKAARHQDERVWPLSRRRPHPLRKRAGRFLGPGPRLGAAGAAGEHGRDRGRRDGRDAVARGDERYPGHLPHPHNGKRRVEFARGDRCGRKEAGHGVHRDRRSQRSGLLRRRSHPGGDPAPARILSTK